MSALASVPFLGGIGWPPFLNVPSDQWESWIKENDKRVSRLLAKQEKRIDHPFYGGMPNDYGIFTPMGTAALIRYASVSFQSASSEYHQSKEMVQAMEIASECLLKLQHEDGTIDLYSTNFHSTPDTGFVVEPICQAYTILSGGQEDKLMGNLKTFLLNAGEALSVGGIHTPNHRWVVCMALARIHHLFPNHKYLKRIGSWLHEKIDIDPDGQYTEKSTHVYSPLTNRCLITISRLLSKPALLEPVRRNLEMTLYYLHANGEVVTEASGRQDQYRIGYPEPYHYAYRYMAIQDKNRRFAAVVDLIEKTASLEELSRLLPYMMEDKRLENPIPEAGILPDNYVREFPYSGLVRIRRKEVDATILADNTSFFTFFKGDAALQAVRLASAFFGKGQFEADSLQVMNNNYVLRQELEGPYYQLYPIAELPDDGDWEKMPRKNRPQSEVQYFKTNIRIEEESPGVFALSFDIGGTENVPLAIELAFRKGGNLTGVEKVPGISDAFFLKKGKGNYQHFGKTIEFGPGLHAHTWTQLRGARPKMDALSVYLTGFTPFIFKLRIQ